MADSKTVDDAKLLEELLEAHVLDLPHIRKIVRRIRIRAARAKSGYARWQASAMRTFTPASSAAVAGERERCAKTAEGWRSPYGELRDLEVAQAIATAIREAK